MKYVFVFLVLVSSSSLTTCLGQIPCEVFKNEDGTERINGSRLCVTLKITNGALDIDRTPSKFVPTAEFTRRLNIPKVEAEELVFGSLTNLLKTIPKPYRFALSVEDKARDDNQQLNDQSTSAIRTTNKAWSDYFQAYSEWLTATNRTADAAQIFGEAVLTDGMLVTLVTADLQTALLVYDDSSYDAERGSLTFAVTDPISNFADESQVKLSLPDLQDGPKKTARLERLRKLLTPLAGSPRCYDCLKNKLEKFYQGLSLQAEISFDNRNTSPLLISIIEAKRIVGASWKSVTTDADVDKLMYSLLTDRAFRSYLKQRDLIRRDKVFNYRQHTGQPGPYLNPQRLQIQQLLTNQLGYNVSLRDAPGDNGVGSSYELTIQKLSDLEEADATNTPTPDSTNEVPDPAPAVSNEEGVVTPHEQEDKNATDFVPKTQPESKKNFKDKKFYIGGGVEYRPGQGPKFFGLFQVSRFPLLPQANNNLSVKVGGESNDGPLGSINYFADYLFFKSLHRRLSLQITTGSDLDANRELGGPPVDERQDSGLVRLEFEPFRDRGGSLLRFFAEGRYETVGLEPVSGPGSTTKFNQSTIEIGAFYFFETTQVERPRTIKLEPKIKFGLGLAEGEPRYNKLLATGNFHQMLARRYELDISGRVELASKNTPSFELPSFGGDQVVRGFRTDDGLGRQVWSLQNELWIPLPLREESTGLKAMLREKVKLAAFVDIGGIGDATDVESGTRAGTGLGLRLIYNPIIFKIDYGYGFGDKATGGARGKFYFGIISNLPF